MLCNEGYQLTVNAVGNIQFGNTIRGAGGLNNTGSLVIQGNYTQTATGVLNMELGGIKALDQLTISGTANLGGVLNVSLLNGFHPAAGADLPILTFGSSAGKFATVDLPSPGNGVALAANLDTHDLMIAALATLMG